MVPENYHLLCPITWHPLQFISSHLVQHFLKKPQPWRSQRYFLQCFTYSCHCFHSCLSPPFVHQLALSSTCFALTIVFSAICQFLFGLFCVESTAWVKESFARLLQTAQLQRPVVEASMHILQTLGRIFGIIIKFKLLSMYCHVKKLYSSNNSFHFVS